MEYAPPTPKPRLPLRKLTTVDRFPIATAAKTAKGGLAAGVIYGVVQDALGAARGRTPGYVDFIRRRGRRKGDLEQIHEP